MTSYDARKMPLHQIVMQNPEAIPTGVRRALIPSTGYKLVQDAANLAKQDKMWPSINGLQTNTVIESMKFSPLQMGMIMEWDKLFIVRVQSTSTSLL
jgi:hypothetical protein